MKSLYLTSVNLDRLVDLLPESANKLTLAFIPTAADPYNDKWFVEEDRKKLKEMGFKIIEIDLKNQNERQLAKLLNKVNVVYLAGGNSFYLLEKIRESGFDKVISNLLEKGVVYAGGSAGAVVAGADIEPTAILDDPKEGPNLKSTKGLGYVDFVILPHYGNKKYEEKYKKILDNYGKKYKLVTLTDKQVIIVKEGKYRILDCE